MAASDEPRRIPHPDLTEFYVAETIEHPSAGVLGELRVASDLDASASGLVWFYPTLVHGNLDAARHDWTAAMEALVEARVRRHAERDASGE